MPIYLKYGHFSEFVVLPHFHKRLALLREEASRNYMFIPIYFEIREHKANWLASPSDCEIVQNGLCFHYIYYSEFMLTLCEETVHNVNEEYYFTVLPSCPRVLKNTLENKKVNLRSLIIYYE